MGLHVRELRQEEASHLGDADIPDLGGGADLLPQAAVEVGVQGGQGPVQGFRLPGAHLPGQARRQVLVVVAEGTHLPLYGLQVPLVELLLGDDVLLGLQEASALHLTGQMEHQRRHEHRQYHRQDAVGGDIGRLHPPAEDRQGLHGRLQAEEEQAQAAQALSLLQEQAEGPPEPQTPQQLRSQERRSRPEEIRVQVIEGLEQGGEGHLKDPCHAHRRKCLPEVHPPRPAHPRRTHRQDGGGAQGTAQDQQVRDGQIGHQNDHSVDQRGGRQGRQDAAQALSSGALVQDGKEIGEEIPVANEGVHNCP